MQTDAELDELTVTTLMQLYDMIAYTEGDPASIIGNVYEASHTVEGVTPKFLVVGYSDELVLEGQPNGVLYPVITRLFVVKRFQEETGTLLPEHWMTPMGRIASWTLVGRQDVVEPIVATPTFAVRKTVSVDDGVEVEETHYIS